MQVPSYINLMDFSSSFHFVNTYIFVFLFCLLYYIISGLPSLHTRSLTLRPSSLPCLHCAAARPHRLRRVQSWTLRATANYHELEQRRPSLRGTARRANLQFQAIWQWTPTAPIAHGSGPRARLRSSRAWATLDPRLRLWSRAGEYETRRRRQAKQRVSREGKKEKGLSVATQLRVTPYGPSPAEAEAWLAVLCLCLVVGFGVWLAVVHNAAAGGRW